MVCAKDCGLQYSEIRAMMPGSGQVTSLGSSHIFMGESPLVMLARPNNCKSHVSAARCADTVMEQLPGPGIEFIYRVLRYALLSL